MPFVKLGRHLWDIQDIASDTEYRNSGTIRKFPRLPPALFFACPSVERVGSQKKYVADVPVVEGSLLDSVYGKFFFNDWCRFLFKGKKLSIYPDECFTYN